MIRVLFLIACLVCVTMADTDEPAQPRKRRRHRASDFVYPYFEISAGAHYRSGCILLERGDMTNAVRHLRAAAYLGNAKAKEKLRCLRLAP